MRARIASALRRPCEDSERRARTVVGGLLIPPYPPYQFPSANSAPAPSGARPTCEPLPRRELLPRHEAPSLRPSSRELSRGAPFAHLAHDPRERLRSVHRPSSNALAFLDRSVQDRRHG